MVWTGTWQGGRAELIIMHRDEDLPGDSYSVESYISTLEKGLGPIYPCNYTLARYREDPFISGGSGLKPTEYPSRIGTRTHLI